MIRGSSSSAMPQRASLGALVNQGTMMLMVSIGALILVLALLILFHQNATATKGYHLRTLERERSKLLLEEEVLNMQLAASQSINVMQEDKLMQALVPVRNPQYSDGEQVVAQRK